MNIPPFGTPVSPPSNLRICPNGSIVPSSEPCPTITFNLFGTLFNDVNGDRIRTSNENGIASWTVTFVGVQSSGALIQQQSVVSSSSGEFFVQFVDGGSTNWFLQIVSPTGWEPTSTPFSGTPDIFQVSTGPNAGGSTIRLDRAFGFRDMTSGSAPTPPVTVPEPSAALLLVPALGGLFLRRVRRREQRVA